MSELKSNEEDETVDETETHGKTDEDKLSHLQNSRMVMKSEPLQILEKGKHKATVVRPAREEEKSTSVNMAREK